jgi:hypothetical protein
MQWKVILEGTDEFGELHRAEVAIEKDFRRAAAGEIGFSITDGKAIMAQLQQTIVKQQCEAYVWTSRFCLDCGHFRPIKDYGRRRIRTVFGCVEVRSPRIMDCRRCLPHLGRAWPALSSLCPDQATPELMMLSARLGSLLPYRKAAEVISEFLPDAGAKTFTTLRHRTLTLGERLDEKARQRAWFEPASTSERRQGELNLPSDRHREFVLSIDTAHVRGLPRESARTFEIAVARCGRGGRNSDPGHYFATTDMAGRGFRSRSLQALKREGYCGRGDVTVISDGADIMKRLPPLLPQPAVHIIDWFHIAMKLQPLQQISDCLARSQDGCLPELSRLSERIRSVKWRLWNGQTDRVINQLETLKMDVDMMRKAGDARAERLHTLAQILLTYVRLNMSAIVNYGTRYRSGQRISTSLAESAVNELVARRMVKKQQMRWSRRGAHLLLQVRTAVLNGDLSEQLAYQPPFSGGKSRAAWLFEPTPPLLRAA